jgi:hypothetical protein
MSKLDDARRASNSFAFRRMLELNPKMARAAARDREKLALEYVRAESLGYGSPLQATAVVDGYDPIKPTGVVFSQFN